MKIRNWVKAWRLRRLEVCLAEHKAERQELERLERITGRAFSARSLRIARDIGRVEKLIEQLQP